MEWILSYSFKVTFNLIFFSVLCFVSLIVLQEASTGVPEKPGMSCLSLSVSPYIVYICCIHNVWISIYSLSNLYICFQQISVISHCSFYRKGDLTPLLSQPFCRPLTASWRPQVWSLCRCQVSTPTVTSAASTRPSSATRASAGVWTQPTGRQSLDLRTENRPVAVKPLSRVRRDNWFNVVVF